MIVPIQSGRSIIPVYIPTTTTNTIQSYEDGTVSAPIEQITSPWDWVILIFVIIILFVSIGLLIEELKKFMEDK